MSTLTNSINRISQSFIKIQNLNLHEASGGTPNYDQRGTSGKKGSKRLYDRAQFGKPRAFGSSIEELENTLEAIANICEAKQREMEKLDWLKQLYGDDIPDQSQSVRTREALKMVGSTPVEVAYILGYRDSKSIVELRKRNGLDTESGERLSIPERPITRRLK